MDALVGFLSGIGVSLVGALGGSLLTRSRERQKALGERRFAIYMKLMDLYGLYFWFTTAEVHKKDVSADIRVKCRSLSWQIADMLREADDVACIDQILEVLFSPGFPTAVKRYEAMGEVLDKMGTQVNPIYLKKIREIRKRNLTGLASGEISNAPGATWP